MADAEVWCQQPHVGVRFDVVNVFVFRNSLILQGGEKTEGKENRMLKEKLLMCVEVSPPGNNACGSVGSEMGGATCWTGVPLPLYTHKWGVIYTAVLQHLESSFFFLMHLINLCVFNLYRVFLTSGLDFFVLGGIKII